MPQKVVYTTEDGKTHSTTLTDEQVAEVAALAATKTGPIQLGSTEFLGINLEASSTQSAYDKAVITVLNNAATRTTGWFGFSYLDAAHTATSVKSIANVVENPVSVMGQLANVKRGCDWNLPSHIWSKSLGETENPYRKGKIFHYHTSANQSNVVIETNGVSTAGGTGVLKNPNDTVDYKYNFATKAPTKGNPRKYGFQFMWNPETYSVSTNVQVDMTPSAGDAFAAGQAMFPGQASMQFTVRLDRVNDFACMMGYKDTSGFSIGQLLKSGYTEPHIIMDEPSLSDLMKNYPDTLPGARASLIDRKDSKHKLHRLAKFGTMADIEYLYRAINDIEIVSKDLPGGYKSADVGYLGFSLVGIELGPVYYIGFITSLSINHLMFTENYVPIRSDVTISVNLMANGGSTSGSVNAGHVGGIDK